MSLQSTLASSYLTNPSYGGLEFKFNANKSPFLANLSMFFEPGRRARAALAHGWRKDEARCK